MKGAAAWPIALQAIAEAAGTQFDAGRPLADGIHAATAQWMAWKINRHIAKDYGIPSGFPYLTGVVIHCEISEEITA